MTDKIKDIERVPISHEQWERFIKEEAGIRAIGKIEFGMDTENKVFIEKFSYRGGVPLNFKNCQFKDQMTLFSYSPTADTYFTDCIFEQGFHLGDTISENKMVFLNCTFIGIAIFSLVKIPRLDLNLRYAKQILFDGKSQIDEIQIGGMERNKIESLSVRANIINKRLELNHVSIEQFYISDVLKSEITVANARIQKLSIETFRNNGSMKFQNCKALENNRKSELIIGQSNLGKSEFLGFDFASYKSVNITQSIIFECVFINSVWSKGNMISRVIYFDPKLETKEDSKPEVLADNLKDVYKQIKYALSKQGDSVQEQFFHGLEMNEYDKSISCKTDFWTKLIIRLSFWTSNFGQSFIRPILCLIGVNSVLFLGLYKLGATGFGYYNVWDLSLYPNTITAVINFINPLHKYDPPLKGGAFVIDTISRIVSSYLIYNIIRATRRFVK